MSFFFGLQAQKYGAGNGIVLVSPQPRKATASQDAQLRIPAAANQGDKDGDSNDCAKLKLNNDPH